MAVFYVLAAFSTLVGLNYIWTMFKLVKLTGYKNIEPNVRKRLWVDFFFWVVSYIFQLAVTYFNFINGKI